MGFKEEARGRVTGCSKEIQENAAELTSQPYIDVEADFDSTPGAMHQQNGGSCLRSCHPHLKLLNYGDHNLNTE